MELTELTDLTVSHVERLHAAGVKSVESLGDLINDDGLAGLTGITKEEAKAIAEEYNTSLGISETPPPSALELSVVNLSKANLEALAAAGVTNLDELGVMITDGRLTEVDGITKAKAGEIAKAYNTALGLNVTPPAAVKSSSARSYSTTYAGQSATAVPCKVLVASIADTHHSKWFREEGLGGQVVPAVEITYRPIGLERIRRVYVYDGDGEGTLKFIKNNGSGQFGHRELDIAGPVQ